MNNNDINISQLDFLIQFDNKYQKYQTKIDDIKKNLQNNIQTIYNYQKIPGMFLLNKNIRGLLSFQDIGTGKTITSLYAWSILLNQIDGTILISPRAIEYNFYEEYEKFEKIFQNQIKKEKIKVPSLEEFKKNTVFVASNANNSYKQLVQAIIKIEEKVKQRKQLLVQTIDYSLKILFIIDEWHELSRQIVNIKSTNGTAIYSLLNKMYNSKFLLLTATPIVSNPFELVNTFNLLKGKIIDENNDIYDLFPVMYEEFQNLFINSDNNTIKNKEIFQERINGLVSTFNRISDTTGKIFPVIEETKVVKIPMSSYQWQIYVGHRLDEIEKERIFMHQGKEIPGPNKIPYGKGMLTFKSKTRKVSIFAFPKKIIIPEKIKNIKDAEKILNQIDLKKLKNKLFKYSPKINFIIKNIQNNQNKLHIVYSQFIKLEGNGIFAKVLDSFGYKNFNKTLQTKEKTYAIWSGQETNELKKKILKIFNDPKNKNGKMIQIILITAAGARGISLMNVQFVHILEPYWHYNRILQIIGRAIRFQSHINLPEKERTIKSFIYLSIEPENVSLEKTFGPKEKETTDLSLYNQSINKQKIIEQFYKLIKEISIDCKINYEFIKNNIDNCKICQNSKNPIIFPNIYQHIQNPTCINSSKIKIKNKNLKKNIKNNVE